MSQSRRSEKGTAMAFDLKGEWSADDVKALLASVEDDRSWRLEVTAQGMAQLTDLTTLPDAAYEDALHACFEIWECGTDYVGPGAASDTQLVAKLAAVLRANYPVLQGAKTLSAL
jgi:hypothetical protein